jgi:MFS family permease
MDYIRFFLSNKRYISFGLLLTFFSSFGQTFLISLYVPDLVSEFSLSNSSFGTMYSAATVVSSILLVYLGKLIDTVDLKKYTLLTGLLLMLSALMISFSYNLIFLFIGLLGIRLSGQGLLSHISNTSISRFYNESRGKALSISVLGYSIGEGFFPLMIGTLLGVIGWRFTMLSSSGAIGLILIPFVFFALKGAQTFSTNPQTLRESNHERSFSRLQMFKDKYFYIIAANTLILPFLITGLFFYQTSLADEKGWSIEWLGASFIGFAVARTLFSLFSGKLIDKFSATNIFPYFLMPFALGLLVITLLDHQYAALIYLFLTGTSMGFSTTLKPAVIAEVYGVKNLGAIKSLFSTLAVLSTAVAPILFGYILDLGYSFMHITTGGIILVLVVIASGFILQANLAEKIEFSRAG